MAPKKREKDSDTSKNPRIDHIQADHELFLQAFESMYIICIFQMKYHSFFRTNTNLQIFTYKKYVLGKVLYHCYWVVLKCIIYFSQYSSTEL